jgi:PAS domain S-box-containing protein
MNEETLQYYKDLLLDSLKNSFLDVAFVLDEDGKYIKVFASKTSLLYKSAKELEGKTLHECLPKEIADNFLEKVHDTIKSKREQFFEYPLEVPAGRRYFRTNTRFIKKSLKQKKKQIIWISRDITSIKKSQEKLIYNEKKYQNLVETSPLGIVSYNLKGEITEINAKALRILASKSKKMSKSINIFEFQNLKDGGFSEKFKQVLETGKTIFYDHEYISLSGKKLYVSCHISALKNAKGKTTGGQITFEDISKKMQINKAIKESEQRLALLMKNIPVSISMTQGENIIFANNSFVKDLGYSLTEVKKMKFWEFIAPEKRERIKAQGLKLLEGRRVKNKSEVPLLTKSGEIRWHKLIVCLIKIDGVPTCLASSIDITEKKLRRKAIEDANIMLEKENQNRKKAEEKLRMKLKIENIIANASNKFINIPVDKVDKNIDHILKIIGEFTKSSRSFVFLYNKKQPVISNTHEWCSEKIESKKQEFQFLPVRSINWLNEQLINKNYLAINSLKSLPKEAITEREIFANKTKSLLLCPMKIGKSLIGFVGCETNFEEKNWQKEEINLIQMISEIFSNAIERKNKEELLFDSYKYIGVINSQLSILLNLGKAKSNVKEKEVIKLILESAKNLSKAKVSALYKYNEKNDALELIESSEISKKQTDRIQELSLNTIPFLNPLKEKKTRIQANEDNIHFYKLCFGKDVKYTVGLPIISQNKILGALFLGFEEKQSASTQDLNFFEVFTIQASYLLMNSNILSVSN